tara:strand:+ start:485 stop:757 length:273 start_codon:yes stop_codon:yes gene_type:complete
MNIESLINDLDSWIYNDKSITKIFEFPSYLAGINFLNKVALLSEKMNHHPDITVSWCKVTILLTTHDYGDVTEKDIHLAKLCDEVFEAHN